MDVDKTSEELSKNDGWNLWTKVYSDRDMRLKLYCRDPEETTPSTSSTLVVNNIHPNCPPRSIIELFKKYGPIEDSDFSQFSSDNRKCLIKFEYVRDAIRACNYYNGYKLLGRCLEVVHYDSANKFCKAEEKIDIDCSTEENVVSYVRQAHLQAERRATQYRFKRNFFTTSCGCDDDKNLRSQNDEENCSNNEDDDDDPRMNKRIKCIDDVLLESDNCFWEWLKGKLNFTGPLHFTHPDIAKAIHKLSPSIRRNFDWLLGAFRLADNFALIGPYLCLKEHTYWAKEMCFVARVDYKVPFKEIWEPCHPTDIKNDRQLIKYVRSMLITFGPLSTTDLKILLMLRCLSEPLRGDPAYSPDGLCRLLEECPLFFVHQDIYYLVREHEHFVGRLKVEDWRTEEFSPEVSVSDGSGSCGASGTCGSGCCGVSATCGSC